MRTLVLAVTALVAFTGCVRRVVTIPAGEDLGEDPAPGTVTVNFVSDHEGQVWDVFTGGEVACQTPCFYTVRAGQGVGLRAKDGDELFVPDLGPEAVEARRAMVVAEGSHYGKYVNGVVFTSLGGMGLVTGIALTAIGCSDLAERGGMCTAGLITAGVSAPLTAASIWLIVDSNPKAHVIPVLKAKAANGERPAAVALVPNGVVGRF